MKYSSGVPTQQNQEEEEKEEQRKGLVTLGSDLGSLGGELG